MKETIIISNHPRTREMVLACAFTLKHYPNTALVAAEGFGLIPGLKVIEVPITRFENRSPLFPIASKTAIAIERGVLKRKPPPRPLLQIRDHIKRGGNILISPAGAPPFNGKESDWQSGVGWLFKEAVAICPSLSLAFLNITSFNMWNLTEPVKAERMGVDVNASPKEITIYLRDKFEHEFASEFTVSRQNAFPDKPAHYLSKGFSSESYRLEDKVIKIPSESFAVLSDAVKLAATFSEQYYTTRLYMEPYAVDTGFIVSRDSQGYRVPIIQPYVEGMPLWRILHEGKNHAWNMEFVVDFLEKTLVMYKKTKVLPDILPDVLPFTHYFAGYPYVNSNVMVNLENNQAKPHLVDTVSPRSYRNMVTKLLYDQLAIYNVHRILRQLKN